MACNNIIASQILTGGASYLNANFGDESGQQGAVGNTFVTGGTRYAICQARFSLRMGNVGSDGYMQARLYEVTSCGAGLWKPTGNPLATSDNVLVSSLSPPFGSYAWMNFNFGCGEQYCMEANHRYAIVLVLLGSTTVTPTNSAVSVEFKWYASGKTWIQNWAGIWECDNDYDLCFYVYGDTISCSLETIVTGLSCFDNEIETPCS